MDIYLILKQPSLFWEGSTLGRAISNKPLEVLVIKTKTISIIPFWECDYKSFSKFLENVQHLKSL